MHLPLPLLFLIIIRKNAQSKNPHSVSNMESSDGNFSATILDQGHTLAIYMAKTYRNQESSHLEGLKNIPASPRSRQGTVTVI